jgi:hypothetical protein
VVDATLTALDADGEGDEQAVAVQGMRLSRGQLLVVRAFELWAHENDVRRAVG